MPKTTNNKIINITIPKQHLFKKLLLQLNGKNIYIGKKVREQMLHLQEGANNISTYYIYDYKIFKFRSPSSSPKIVVDTIAPHLLKKPVLTNQGLILEFTEPAIIETSHKRYFTDSSYTAIIPKKFITSNTIIFTVKDTLGNAKKYKLIINRNEPNKSDVDYKVSGNILPNSAGIKDFLNLSVITLIGVIFAMPYLITRFSLNFLKNRA